MKRDNPFRISALNSLKVHQVQIKDQKQLLNTFKGANDLRTQLNKNKNSSLSAYKKSLQNNTQQFSKTTINMQKPQQQALMEQVAALDNFKAPVTRQKTKNLIQNIKIRRRQKHIQAYNHFKQDLDDYKQNLLSIYQSMYNDCNQVLNIKQAQLSGYLNSQSDQYLLSREKEILLEFLQEYELYKKTTSDKIRATKEELERIKSSRGSVVDQTCEMLRLELIQIAFVLQDEARQIEMKQKQQISNLEQQFYQKYKTLISQLSLKQQQKYTLLHTKMLQVQQKWKNLKQTFQIQQFQSAIKSQPYLNPVKRKQLYQQLIALQQQNHEKKKKILQSLIVNQHVDSLRKVNIQKWSDLIKTINQQFDKKLDLLVQKLMQQFKQSKQKHLKLLTFLQTRLKYIQNHSEQQITQMLTTKFTPLVQKNITTAQQTIKKATNYIQFNDQKQNTLMENLLKFINLVGQNNDQFVKEFTSANQKYQIEKAKILDDDQELVEKLEKELAELKKELRESLHHIKLEEVEGKCFGKIDEIEQAYRKTHQNNKELVASRPQKLNAFVQGFQAKMAAVFQLYQENKKAQLAEKNKQEAQKQAMRRIQEEDKKKLQEEQKQAQLIKKNGGKAPPPAKPKDPKKLAAQIQQRKKVILTQMGQKKIQQLKTGSGNTWLVFRSLQQISKQFYKSSSPQQQKKQPQNQQPKKQGQQPEVQKVYQVDQLQDPIKDVQGQKITTNQTILKIKNLAQYLLLLRDKIFQNIDTKRTRILSQAEKNDTEMLEQSLMTLDDRLKKHYSLKGQLQAQIFLKRSGQITNHKKRYEKYARTVRQKMDLQTQRFNFLLQKSLQQLKNHNADQKKIRQQLPSGKNLSQLQGMLGKARQNFNKFTQQINQIVKQLNHLSKNQVQILLQKNKDFIKQSKLLKDGGQYSQEQIKWYEQMMKQITDQIKIQQTKRQEKTKEIQDQSNKRKKQLLEKFQKQYHSSIQELSAKDGTGKVYGKPKRIAQEKVRFEMNKCEQAQISIKKQVDVLTEIYDKQNSKGFKFIDRPTTLDWRRKLMTLFTCIEKYAKHLEALKKELKIKPMVRVNYDQNLPQCTVTSPQEDKKLMEQELKQLGPLSQQKQDKNFMKYIADIQKIISDQSRTIYVGDKAKYLTGNQKIPEFLRKYIANMRQSAQDFRQNSIRQLRDTCIQLSDLCQKLSQLFFCSIQTFFIFKSHQTHKSHQNQFMQLYKTHEIDKKQNLRLLRPNLSNPKCQGQLKTLHQKQISRQKLFLQQINKIKQSFKLKQFSNGQTFMNCLINNYQFLLQYCDSLYLFEDFVKVKGDDDQEKKKLNIKKLMVMKQKGINIDSSSQRNLKKKWQGVNFTIVNFDELKFSYKKVEVEEANSKDAKKGAKKDTKKPANQPVAQTQTITNSKQIQTFKTWRQKSVFQMRQKCSTSFKQTYDQTIKLMYQKINQSIKQNQDFNKKWMKIYTQLQQASK